MTRSHAPQPGADPVTAPLAAVITVSDRSAAGERADAGGPIAVEALRANGFACAPATIVPDGAESVAGALRAAIAEGARVIVTTGGTGIGPRDRTPEGTREVIDREVPGIAEELRRAATAALPAGMLSRGLAGIAGRALVVNLPGSPGAVRDGMPVIASVARHIVAQIDGADHPHHDHGGADRGHREQTDREGSAG